MKVQLKVRGMTCNHCISMVNKAIVALQTDAKVTVDLAQQQVSVAVSYTHLTLPTKA